MILTIGRYRLQAVKQRLKSFRLLNHHRYEMIVCLLAPGVAPRDAIFSCMLCKPSLANRKGRGMKHYLKPINSLLPVFLAALVIVGCGNVEQPKQVSLAMLTENAASFDNTDVITRGTVRHFEAPLHYWIEDENWNRVEVFPHDRVALFLGETVLVEGHFRFSYREGRRLTLTTVKRE